jgi:hypothetical protein
MMRSRLAAGMPLRFFRARSLTATVQLMAELLEGHELSFGDFLAPLFDCGALVRARVFLWQFGDPLVQAAGAGGLHVATQRLPYEFGARMVLLAAHALKFIRHLRHRNCS